MYTCKHCGKPLSHDRIRFGFCAPGKGRYATSCQREWQKAQRVDRSPNLFLSVFKSVGSSIPLNRKHGKDKLD